jgi:chemotaxis protein histidine kinase CheA
MRSWTKFRHPGLDEPGRARMSEPILDLSEIMDLYKADARRMVGEMQSLLGRWEEVASSVTGRKELRRLAHQLRGSGRTYGFRDVSRICKAMETIVIKFDSQHLTDAERIRQSLCAKVERLATIFG